MMRCQICFLFAFFITVCLSASSMDLHLLESPDAKCNDGSPAGFYFSPSVNNSNTWVVHLQGGGFCYDLQSCTLRNKSAPQLMSSLPWSKTMTGSGILSQKESDNPYLWFANHVFIGYCSSDSFSGYNSNGINGWVFYGSEIVRQTFFSLMKLGIDQADTVLFTGTSAGAEGLYVNADEIRDIFEPSVNFLSVLDSGWFLDFDPYQTQSCRDLGSCTEHEALKRGVKIWNPRVNQQCAQAKTESTLWECTLAYHAYPFVKTPMFIMEFGFDAAQMGHDGIHHIPQSGSELTYAQEARRNLTNTFVDTNANAVFSPSCYHHGIIRSRKWTSLQVGGISLPFAINEWVKTGAGMYLMDQCNTPNCNPTCP